MQKGVELAISTYNRPYILQKWLDVNYREVINLGFSLAVYDSSSQDETEKLILQVNSRCKKKIKYRRIDSNIRLDEKVIISMVESDYEYVWPLGDSRYINFTDLENKVVPFLNENYDYLCIWSESMLENDGVTYCDPASFFSDCFWHVTWLGSLIIKKELLSGLNDSNILEKYISKYNRNDGFSYLGIFFDIISHEKCKGAFSIVEIGELVPNKSSAWLKRYLEVWCDNLCFLIDNLDPVYDDVKEKVIREVWDILNFDGPSWCYKARKAGGLTKEKCEFYCEQGLIDRVSPNKKRIMRFASLPSPTLEIYYFTLRVFFYLRKRVRKLLV